MSDSIVSARKIATACSLALLIAAACGTKTTRTQRTDPRPPPVATPAEAEVASFPEPQPEAETPYHSSRAATPQDPSEAEMAESLLTPEERALQERLRDMEFEALRQSADFNDGSADAPAIEEEAQPALIDEIIDEIEEAPIPEDFSLAENREARLRATKSGLPLVLNSQVIQFVNYFTGRGKKTMIRSLERAEAYRPMIESILAEEGIPQELIHLAQAESGFRPKARSRARATGMWQFMSFRGRQYGLRRDRHLDERYDPEKATRAAAEHLHDLYIEFGDWYLAMAAYNSGPMRVKRAIDRAGSRDYWTLLKRRLLPRETRNYVPIILAMVYVAKNLDMYGFDEMAPAEEITYNSVETESEIHFDLIADVTGSTTSQIKDLNPALLRSATPPFRYNLRLPKGTAERFERDIALIPAAQRLAWRRHQVREGESLASIAKKYRVQPNQIASTNGLEGDELSAERWLNIPASPKRLRYYGTSGGAGGLLEGGSGRYRIARGDNLGGIARRFGVSVSQLRRWNGLTSNRIIAGRYLIVDPDGNRSVSASASGSGTYRIRRGDTLGTIARRHGVSVAQLRAWNGLRGNNIIAGKTLIVGSRQSSSRSSSASRQAAPRQPDLTASKYRIRRGDNLATIGKRFGVTVAELQAWNGLRGSSIRAGSYLIVRPKGSSAAASRSIIGVAHAASEVPASTRTYRIRRGDNLAMIARRFGVTVEDLKAWNGLRSSRITAGESLTVNGSAARVSSATFESGARSETPPSAARQRYRIRRGDTLGSIAKRFGVTVQQLREWNGLRGNRITAGRDLIIRAAAPRASARSVSNTRTASAPTRYRIQRGDTLATIARRFGVTVADLKAWNGLRSSRITAGDYLTVRPPSEQARAERSTAGS